MWRTELVDVKPNTELLLCAVLEQVIIFARTGRSLSAKDSARRGKIGGRLTLVFVFAGVYCDCLFWAECGGCVEQHVGASVGRLVKQRELA